MLWSLINTLQLISFLPLMITFYPEHVKIMFEILGFVNMDIQVLSDLFKKYINIEGFKTPSYNPKFLENGIDTTLFLDN